MNENQNKESWAKIKLFGDYEEVKDIIWKLPKTKEGKYFYAIFTSNWKTKVGVTENPISRFKAHEHGLNVYGNSRIKKILITHPTLQYKELENLAINKMEEKYKKSGAEFFSTGNIFDAVSILFHIIKPFNFYEIAPMNSYYDALIEHLVKYFSLFPDETSITVKTKDLRLNNFDKLNESDISKRIKSLSKIYPNIVKVISLGTFYISKEIINLDIVTPRITKEDYSLEEN